MRADTPSRTARKVAVNTILAGADPKRAGLLPEGCADATARLLSAAGVMSDRSLRTLSSPWVLRMVGAFEGLTQGLVGVALRRRFCESEVRRAIASGATQVVVLGAGYDTLGWRLAPEFPDVQFVELDHPATARGKAAGIRTLGTRENLHLVAVDLARRPLSDVLGELSAWEPTADSVFIAEGLLMYLAEEAVQELFRQAAASGGAGSRVVFSYVGTRPDGRPDAGRWTGVALWGLRLVGEPWLWSEDPTRIDAFVRRCGWRPVGPAEEGLTGGGFEHFGVVVRDAPSATDE